MQVPARLGKERRYMAGGAPSAPFEDLFSSRRCPFIERAFGRLRRRGGELIELQGAEFSRDQVGTVPHVPEPGASGYGELQRVIQTGIEKGSLAVHLEVRHESIPVRDRSPARPGVQ